jgi:cytochrome P450
MTAEVVEANLADPATFARPGSAVEAVWWRLRREQPVSYHPETAFGPGFWVVTRYADALTVYKDPKTFVSGRGNMLTSLLAGGDPAGGALLAVSDPPRHSEIRALLLSSFSVKILRRVAEGVRVKADELVARAVAAGGGDFAALVADQLPMATISDLLGVPEADRARMLELSKQALASEDPDQSARGLRMARSEIVAYFAALARDRRRAPTDDVIGMLVSAEAGGRPLTLEEVALNCYGLILAGDETSRLGMIAAVRNFVEFPEVWRALRDGGQAAVPPLVEEILRWNSPAMHVGRTAAADVELGGQLIRAGDLVTVWNSSANRDEAVFADPDRFDARRDPNRHLAFGHGPHFCLGAYLGRAEIGAVVDALRRHAAGIVPTGEPRPLYSTFLRGFATMPVAFHPARKASP